MTYQETLDFMFSSLPMYHRIGKAAYKADLTSTEHLMTYLGHPERQFPSIHIAGTNGKGSVSHLTASALQEAGYRVGLYTSPHLIDFRERIRINGQMIPEDEVTRFVAQHQRFMQHEQLSFFEMTVGLAFDYFARQQVDVAVVEVGMGGRLDSTNVVAACLSVITNIGLDHTQFLGDTLPKIAAEKAGIIKYGVPVVVGETNSETKPVFEARAAEQEAPMVFADSHFTIIDNGADADELHFSVLRDGVKLYAGWRCPLAGSYQLHNLATFFQVVEMLYLLDYDRLDDDAVRRGVANVKRNTGLHGRWEVIGHEPLVVCETAHNADGVRAMLQKLSQLNYSRLHIIYGCVNDKDYAAILRMLPHEADYIYTQPSVPRALAADQLAAAAEAMGMMGPHFATVDEALAHALAHSEPTDMVLITGSIFLVADALRGRI
ncbi:MAG: bifunctional folylpolyglutamate synthase/dihydrofolate synthase [Bacteroidales bacterium]|nr:bifunctional folylpolyglutamate synthase/dihydrofolate synthase [Bacteroidales bacterium]